MSCNKKKTQSSCISNKSCYWNKSCLKKPVKNTINYTVDNAGSHMFRQVSNRKKVSKSNRKKVSKSKRKV